MSLFLGIDVSTTAAKALLLDNTGRVVSSASTPLTLSTLRPLWSEQRPQDWWQATAASIRQALNLAHVSGAQVAAIGLTGQMHGLVLLDDSGEVLRPAILWNDQRCGAECDEIRGRIGKARLIQITGNDALTWSATPGAFFWNTYRGTIPSQLLGSRPYPPYDQTCYERDDSHGDGPLVATDPAGPPLGTAFYYDVTDVTGCGEGPLGFYSDGTVIPNTSRCLIP